MVIKGFPIRAICFEIEKKTLNIHAELIKIFFIILDILCHLWFEQYIGQMPPATPLVHLNPFKPIFDDFVEHFWWYGCNSGSDIGLKLSNCLWFNGIKLRFYVSPKGVKSQDLGGQLKGPFLEIIDSPNFPRNKFIVSPAVWQVAPSCWK